MHSFKNKGLYDLWITFHHNAVCFFLLLEMTPDPRMEKTSTVQAQDFTAKQK